jgi:exopolysaccharide biosynthesis protein
MNEKDREKKLKKRILKYLTRFFVTLLVSVILLAGGIYSVMFMLVNGPSKTASDLFVMSVKETSAIGFLANWFFTDDEIKEIIDRNSIKNTDEVTDPNLVKVEDKDTNTTGDEPKKEQEPIEIIDIKGATYRGKLMIVKDPKRVFVGTCPTFSMAQGEVVSDMAKRYKAVAGVNGGEFVDGENTYTAMPVGLVIVDGKIKNGDLGTTYHVTGFTKDNILVVGNMTGKEALEKNINYCVSINNSIGPFLIINGTPMDVSGVGGGLNPRTAIGQRADGSILLLAIDGRQANSLGASFADLVYIMQEHGAVNASTMDGGTSTQMYYNGAVINKPYSPTGPRNCPTAFLVGGE